LCDTDMELTVNIGALLARSKPKDELPDLVHNRGVEQKCKAPTLKEILII